MLIGHRSAIRHTRGCPGCKSRSGARRRHAVRAEDSIANNKQHAGGIEQLSRSKTKASSLGARLFNRNKHCQEWTTDEADNRQRDERKERTNEWAEGIHF